MTHSHYWKDPAVATIGTVFVCWVVGSLLLACQQPAAPALEEAPLHSINWDNRSIDTFALDSLETGKTYLSVNSTIYSRNQKTTIGLTVTVSLRNTSEFDTIYVNRVDYYGTNGELLKKYVSKPVFIMPMETIEIVIEQNDRVGGTGGNFIFEWMTPHGVSEPLFESVMLYYLGTSAFSFNKRGVRIE